MAQILETVRIFVSSTFRDLKQYRQAAQDVILSLGFEAEMVSALSNLNEAQVAEVCTAKAQRCDACVLILGFSLGCEPQDLKAVERKLSAYNVGSFTSIELKAAQDIGLPIFIYVLRESALNKNVRKLTEGEMIPIRRKGERVPRFRHDISSDQMVRIIDQDLNKFQTSLAADLSIWATRYGVTQKNGQN